MTDHDQLLDDPKLAEARARIRTVALGLTAVLGPLDAASTLLGAGVAVLSQAHGDDWAAAYLRELATELESDDNPYQGHA